MLIMWVNYGQGENVSFFVHPECMLHMNDAVCVPEDGNLK